MWNTDKCFNCFFILLFTVLFIGLLYTFSSVDIYNLEIQRGNVNNTAYNNQLPAHYSYNHNYSLNVNNTQVISNERKKIFKILYWTSSYYGGKKWFGIGSDIFKTCEYSNCIATNDRKQYSSSDALLMHLVFMEKLPKPRLPNQKWIMHIREAPLTVGNYARYNGVFNATWTYDRRSDIWTNSSQVHNVGNFHRRSVQDNELATRNYATGKTKVVAWFVSHCSTHSKREKYVKQLQKHISVDIYGKCGPLNCAARFGANKDDAHKCLDLLESTYKFYLSFENSLCDDYVTEKLWTPIKANIVPIVMGAFNYSELMPPHSYIDIKDYNSPKELADHLKKVDKDDDLYNSYLQWKGDYEIKLHPPMQCNLCEYLNLSDKKTKNYDRLDLFWDPKTKCYSPDKFYNNMDASVFQ